MNVTQNIFKLLNARTNYAVLRNYEGLPLKNSGRDIDLLIEKKEFLIVEKEIINIIKNANFKILTRYRSEKMIAYVLAKVIDGHTELVQFDFLFEDSFFGIFLLNTKKVLASRVFNGSIYHVSEEYEFLDKYLWLKCIGAPYPEKYALIRNKMKENQKLSQLLKDSVNCSNLEQLEKLSSFQLKRRLLFKNLRKDPLIQTFNLLLFFVYHIRNKAAYKGFSIGFTGPDGSGKTTVIDTIVAQLNTVYSDIKLFHFRPTIIPNLGEAAHKTKLKSEVDKDYSNPHRSKKTSKISSLIRLFYYSIDYILGYFIKIRPFLQKRSLIVFDRYYTDIIADSRRSRIFLNTNFLFWFGKIFIPSLDYNILLTANEETILARKQELTAKGIKTINRKLIYLANKKDYYLVINDRSPAEAIQEIMTIIFDKQQKKNLKRLR